jgi:hypothetical protein
MRNPARSDRYCNFIASLENSVLYSADGVLKHATERGLLLESELQTNPDFLRSAAHALTMRITRKSVGPPDGYDRLIPETPRDAYFGLRWKATIPDRYLEESDRELVQRYIEEPDSLDYLFTQIESAPPGEAQEKDGRRRTLIAQPLLLATALGLLLVLVLLLFEQPNADQERLAKLQQNEDLSGLRSLLDEPAYSDMQDTVIESIAKLQFKLGHEVPIFADLSELTAVFAFDQDPQLLFGYRVLRPGDPLTLAENHGYLTEIGREGLVLRTASGLRAIPYPPLNLFGKTNWDTPPVLVYPGQGGLAPVLEHACREAGLSLDLQRLAGPIVGAFECQSFLAFVDRVAPALGLLRTGDVVRDSGNASPLQSCIGFDRFFPYVDTTVGAALAEYQRLLDLHLIVHSQQLSMPIALPPTQLSDFVAQLEFTIRTLGHDLVEIKDPT